MPCWKWPRRGWQRYKLDYKEAMLANAGDVRVIYLLVDDPQRYHKFAVADNTIGITRKVALRHLFATVIKPTTVGWIKE